MSLKVFISWSGIRSKALALELQEWLRQVIQAVQPWMSETDIHAGDRWPLSIGDKLAEHDIGILCMTPENRDAPWLLFEAGALSKALERASVIPLLFQLSPDDLRGGPLAQFQAVSVHDRDGVLKLVRALNSKLGNDKLSEDVLKKAFERSWGDLKRIVKKVEKVEVRFNAASLHNVIDVFARHNFPSPSIESSAFFAEGFETYQVYEIVSSIARKRLYNYSRMNRKILDKQFESFYKDLPRKVAEGFDFKLLFLDPNAPDHVIRSAHEDFDFRTQLRRSLEQAIVVFERFGLDPDRHCRTYEVNRSFAITVVDEAVLFAPVKRDTEDVARRLTRASFSILPTSSGFGGELLENFLSLWEVGGRLAEAL